MVWRCAVWQSNAILLKREKKMADVLTEQHQSFKGRVQKKNCEKAVRLTAWVDPPLPSPEAVRKM